MKLTDYNYRELAALLADRGEPRFRAKQVNEWLLRGAKPMEMRNLPLPLREKLASLPYGGAEIAQTRVSQKDETEKYLFTLDGGNLVEGVFMRYRHGNTLCLSTQVGCRMNCAFCASGLDGCVRNLSSGEMLSMLLRVEQRHGESARGRNVRNIVLMGSGEPLDNYDEVLRFLHRVTGEDGLHISARNISLSTCGIVPKLMTLPDDAPHVTLSVSLHAPTDAQRNELMPINRVYPIAELMAAARHYAEKTGRRIIFEYALIGGFNDSKADADALAKLLRNLQAHVNLIPLNPVPERNLAGCTREHAKLFENWLAQSHISATVRREMGTDIEGACGQLRRKEESGKIERAEYMEIKI
ncbi:MAG: 23S rRNA (adenine(2503)-C(2))-methyltransferase RlmN [Clostridiales bacterium]|nr:23S rRNA (adenine(2503)-C(2))-methyltransferase RlmN [Clostridiales bacterium]